VVRQTVNVMDSEGVDSSRCFDCTARRNSASDIDIVYCFTQGSRCDCFYLTRLSDSFSAFEIHHMIGLWLGDHLRMMEGEDHARGNSMATVIRG
jgi:hypothetical protein